MSGPILNLISPLPFVGWVNNGVEPLPLAASTNIHVVNTDYVESRAGPPVGFRVLPSGLMTYTGESGRKVNFNVTAAVAQSTTNIAASIQFALSVNDVLVIDPTWALSYVNFIVGDGQAGNFTRKQIAITDTIALATGDTVQLMVQNGGPAALDIVLYNLSVTANALPNA